MLTVPMYDCASREISTARYDFFTPALFIRLIKEPQAANWDFTV
jgi:hypothetical protein